jgi:hypothetical protein
MINESSTRFSRVTCSETLQKRYDVRSAYFDAAVTPAWLNKMTAVRQWKLVADLGTVLALKDAPIAHEMLAGRPHRRGKIVLDVDQGPRKS